MRLGSKNSFGFPQEAFVGDRPSHQLSFVAPSERIPRPSAILLLLRRRRPDLILFLWPFFFVPVVRPKSSFKFRNFLEPCAKRPLGELARDQTREPRPIQQRREGAPQRRVDPTRMVFLSFVVRLPAFPALPDDAQTRTNNVFLLFSCCCVPLFLSSATMWSDLVCRVSSSCTRPGEMSPVTGPTHVRRLLRPVVVRRPWEIPSTRAGDNDNDARKLKARVDQPK